MAGWYPFKQPSWYHELAGLGFSERKSLLFMSSTGPADSKIPGELLFFKKNCAIMPHTQRLGFEIRVGVGIWRQPGGLSCRFEAGASEPAA
jgi:hypothetical protein